jgi:hypothetical protein
VSNPLCYFRSITLRNVKTFGDEQTLSFLDSAGRLAQWTLLLGDNGVGKTTILQCLTELCADLARPMGIQKQEKEPERFLPRLVTRYVFDNSASPYGRVASSESVVSAEIIANRKLGESSGHGQKVFRAHWSMKDGQFPGCSVVPKQQASLQPYAYGAFRRFGSTKLGAELNRDACETLFSENEPLINVEEWLLRADYAAEKSKGSKATKRLAQIKELLIRLLPEVSDIRIRPSGTEVPTPEAKTPDGWVPVLALSTGYRATMAWLTDFTARMLERYPDSLNPCAEPAVVLIDQIDTHLHPKWQRQLVSDLSETFPATQFIVTAHSPLMVQAMPQANIVVLRRDGDHVSICNRPDDVRGWRIDQIVASDLFEEQPTRDVETDEKLEERRKLISKKTLTKEETTRLKFLNEWAEGLPTADTPEDIRAMDLIRRAADKIQKS